MKVRDLQDLLEEADPRAEVVVDYHREDEDNEGFTPTTDNYTLMPGMIPRSEDDFPNKLFHIPTVRME